MGKIHKKKVQNHWSEPDGLCGRDPGMVYMAKNDEEVTCSHCLRKMSLNMREQGGGE